MSVDAIIVPIRDPRIAALRSVDPADLFEATWSALPPDVRARLGSWSVRRVLEAVRRAPDANALELDLAIPAADIAIVLDCRDRVLPRLESQLE